MQFGQKRFVKCMYYLQNRSYGWKTEISQLVTEHIWVNVPVIISLTGVPMNFFSHDFSIGKHFLHLFYITFKLKIIVYYYIFSGAELP